MKNYLLEQYGVYLFFGYEIQNFKELGLEADKTYRALKTSEYVKNIAKQLGSKDIDLISIDKFPIGEVLEHKYLDGILFINVSNELEYDIASMYSVTATKENGTHIGVEYDLVLSNPELNSVHYVEKKRPRVNYPA